MSGIGKVKDIASGGTICLALNEVSYLVQTKHVEKIIKTTISLIRSIYFPRQFVLV